MSYKRQFLVTLETDTERQSQGTTEDIADALADGLGYPRWLKVTVIEVNDRSPSAQNASDRSPSMPNDQDG